MAEAYRLPFELPQGGEPVEPRPEGLALVGSGGNDTAAKRVKKCPGPRTLARAALR
jgi:hypothetical protein